MPHAHAHVLTNTGYIGSIPKEGKSDKLFFFPSFCVEFYESFVPSPLNPSTLTVCFTGQGCEVLCFHRELGSQMYTFICCYAFFSCAPYPHIYIPASSPFSLLGSLPWWGGQTSCDSAAVCRTCSARGPQALDDNQPNLSRRFSTAWKIHGPICQTWNGLLHCLEFLCVSSDHFTECHTVAAVTGSDSLFLLIPSPPLFSCWFNASSSSYCMLIRGTWSDRGSSAAFYDRQKGCSLENKSANCALGWVTGI